MGSKAVIPVRWLRQELGGSLLETVAAVGILGGVIVMFLAALTTHSVATRSADANNQALNLVRTQLEDIKNATYNTANCYPVSVTAPSGYLVSVTTVPDPAGNLQKVTVTTSRSGTTHLSVEMYKANTTGTVVNQAC